MRAVAGFIVMFLLALLLLGQLSAETLEMAGGLALLTQLWRRLLRSASRRAVRPPRAGQLAAWTRSLAMLPGDTLRVGRALGRAFGSRASPWRAADVPFRFGAVDDPGERGRRAVAVIAGSLSPDRIVVDVQSDRLHAATHRLTGGADGSREWLS